MRRWILLCALLVPAALTHAIPSSEREALIAIYHATGGPAWTRSDNWLGPAGSECTWYGVSCTEEGANVLDLELYENNLQGTVPPAIGSFPHLRSLQLWSNSLQGPLPSQLGQLSALRAFFAGNNHFSGPIPAELANLRSLEVLYLDGNELTGSIPRELGTLPALSELGLSSNRLSGSIPRELANATNLGQVGLSSNQLTGAIPRELGSLQKLQYLSAADNRLEGSIPPELGNASALLSLILSYNRLTGTIPSELGALSSLEQLLLNNNELTGTIPDSFRSLVALKELDVTTNMLSGALPPVTWAMTSLVELEVGDNDFSGPISTEVGALAQLQVLSLYANRFTGPIPPQIGTIVPLRSLELQSNELSGSLPPELSQLSSLVWLDLSDNALEGPVPRELSALQALEILSLYDNQLSGTIPPELGQLSTLRYLYLAMNRLEGPIPDALRSLTKLERFSADGNALTGPIPSWIGEWTQLAELFLGSNDMSGPLPQGLSTLENLFYLDIADNQFSGPLPDFTRLQKLVYLSASYNRLSGPLPQSFGSLANLDYVQLNDNALSGPLPEAIGGLDAVTFLSLQNNQFEGSIPSAIGQLDTAYNISLGGNRFTGTIPKEIGNLTGLQFLDLSFNALRGPIPPEIVALTGLEDFRSDFSYNALYSNDPVVVSFMNRKQYDGAFEATQTVTPTDLRVVSTTDRSATLTWQKIAYLYDAGGYQVVATTAAGGVPVAVATTPGKELDSIVVRNLAPATNYFFTVAAVTHPHWGQKNLIVSDPSAAVRASTGQRVVAPPEIVLTDTADGMVQIDGSEVGEDSFSLTNFGDVATTVTLERGGDFFTASPETFTLAPGATQVVTLHSIPQPAGTYYGHVAFRGEGEPEEPIAYVVLLSASRPEGSVIAQPLASTIELAGEAGSEEVGIAEFRNSGTARLTGIVVSDQPWIEVPPETITIDPGTVGVVNFRVVRSKRPAGAEGALAASLSLVYVNGTSDSFTAGGLATTIPVSVSKVTVIDVTKPQTSIGPLPPLGNEVAFLVPGVISSASLRSDLSLVNAAGTTSVSDLRLYFTRQSQTSVAALQPLAFARSVTLANVVNSVYSMTGSGTLQVRSSGTAALSGTAKITAVTDAGSYSGLLPIFRSDRSSLAGTTIYLAGVTPGADLFLQESGGGSGTVRILYLNQSGIVVGDHEVSISAGELRELPGAVPAGAIVAAVTNAEGSTALIDAYARQRAGEDVTSIVDWGRFHQYTRAEAVRIPFADGRSGGSRRRRAVRTNADPRATDVVLFNPAQVELRAAMQVIESSGRTVEREVTVPPRHTVVVTDAAAGAGTPLAQVVVTPIRGELVVSARSRGANGGAEIPVLAAGDGLRLGQSQVFSSLDDSAAVRTGYGIVESGGGEARVRVRILIDESSSLVTATTVRELVLQPHQQLFFPELVRSFAGDARDELYGDLHGLTLQFEVIEGAGAVVPYLFVTDTASEDSLVMVQ